jgi:hypothetical protein
VKRPLLVFKTRADKVRLLIRLSHFTTLPVEGRNELHHFGRFGRLPMSPKTQSGRGGHILDLGSGLLFVVCGKKKFDFFRLTNQGVQIDPIKWQF